MTCRSHPVRNIWSRLSPILFALGFLGSFAFCSYLGFTDSQRNPFPHFLRFYDALSQSSGYFASVNQLIALCKSQVSGSDVLVVIGGNSTFVGVGQQKDEVWSKRLAESLGAGYVVVNLAQRAGPATGSAEVVAEALVKQGYRVVYLANILPMDINEPDGGGLYGYMFWNAQARGLLFPWKAREDYFLREDDSLPRRHTMKIRAAFDRFTNSEDLWNSVCYDRFCTTWDPYTGGEFWKPRKDFPDKEWVPGPAPQRFAADLEREVGRIRDFVKMPGGSMDNDYIWGELGIRIEAGFVPQMRSRSLIVVSSYCSYYVHQLSAEEQARYGVVLQRTVDKLHNAGLRSIEAGSRYGDDDYGDMLHFTPSGGERLAHEVAPEVRRIAREVYGR